MMKYARIAAIAVLALCIVLSCTVVGTRLSDPATYTHTIQRLDDSRTTVLSLSAASAAASAAISALPSDICSPLAQQLSEFTTWFLLILSVVYLEKYLLTILGAAACYLLIPLGCAALLVCCFYPAESFRRVGTKLLALGAAVLLVIPTSVWVSDQINAIYSQSIAAAVESANAVSENLVETTTGESADATVIDKAKAILDDFSGSAGIVVTQFKNVLSRFVEATAVMIVTTCLIPLLVIGFFLWMVKTLFGIPIVLPQQLPRPFRKLPRREDAEDRTAEE